MASSTAVTLDYASRNAELVASAGVFFVPRIEARGPTSEHSTHRANVASAAPVSGVVAAIEVDHLVFEDAALGSYCSSSRAKAFFNRAFSIVSGGPTICSSSLTWTRSSLGCDDRRHLSRLARQIAAQLFFKALAQAEPRDEDLIRGPRSANAAPASRSASRPAT